MEWILWLVGYLVVGTIILAVLWKALKIEWGAEAMDTKLLMIATPFAWPIVLIFIAGSWLKLF